MNFIDRMVHTPHPHQLKEFIKYRDHEYRALLWYMRTGKTKSCIDLLSYLYTTKKIVTVVIVAPNGVHYNWTARELPEHLWKDIEYECFTWFSNPVKKSIDLIRSVIKLHKTKKLMVIAINSEALILDRALDLIKIIDKRGPALLIVDESHDFRSPGSKRTKRMLSIARRFKYKRILTGTVVDNSPLAAYSQFNILKNRALGAIDYDHFKSIYAIFGAKRAGNRVVKQVVGYKNLPLLKKQMSKLSSRVGRKNMPPFAYEVVYFEMTGKQLQMYEKLKREFCVELEEDEKSGAPAEIIIPKIQTRILKLQQILSGFFLYDGNPYYISNSQRIKALEGVLKKLDFDEKIIIWCKFREDINLVDKLCREQGMQVFRYHGGVNAYNKKTAIESFMGGPYIGGQVFLGQPQSGGSGLNLSKASTVIFYSHTFNSIEYNQAKERATKIHGHTVTLIDICGIGSVDEYILRVLKEKRTIADEVMGDSYLKEYLT